MRKISSLEKGGVGLLLFGATIFLLNTISTDKVAAGEDSEIERTTFVVATSSLNLRVSGVLSATDKAIVSAKTAGMIQQYHVDIGSVVTSGSLLVSQATPVAAARLALSESEASLVAVKQAAAVDETNFGAKKAQTVSYSAEEIAALKALSNDNRIAEVTSQVLTTSKSSVISILSAIQFVNTNRSLFRAESIKEYEQVVTNLYGSVPNHFRGGITRPNLGSEDLLGLINDLGESTTPPVLAVINLSALVEMELQSLVSVYVGAESEVFDRRLLESTDQEYITYFEYRTKLVAALSAMIQARSNFQLVVDAAASDKINQATAVDVSLLDKELAASQALFSEQISAAARVLAQAALSVATTEVAEGRVQAPFAGLVTKRFKSAGEYAVAGEPLLLLTGTAGRELVVTVPTIFASLLRVGQALEVNREVVGVIEQFSTRDDGNAITVVISISNSKMLVGSTVFGDLVLESNETVFSIPRSHLHFSSTGPKVESRSGDIYPVEIVYDDGKNVYVAGTNLFGTSLKPAYSLDLN